MKQLNEVRKEDDLYFVGPFWIIAESEVAINKGQFKLIGETFPVDYQGDYQTNVSSRKGTTAHKQLWTNYVADYPDKSYKYFPRGRVRIVDGEVFIHLNSKMNNPYVVNAVVNMYGLSKLSDNINIEEDDLLQGNHYDFELPKR